MVFRFFQLFGSIFLLETLPGPKINNVSKEVRISIYPILPYFALYGMSEAFRLLNSSRSITNMPYVKPCGT